jgi:glucosyl-3-phosphoglycerate synthase
VHPVPQRSGDDRIARARCSQRAHRLRRLVDELIVLDDRSNNATATIAAESGATVIPIATVHDRYGAGDGKGNALWSTLAASSSDIVMWCDGDVTSFQTDWVARLVAPLLDDPTVGLVKANYERPMSAGGGGRTTELVARPLLSLYVPELTAVRQPLAGEFAGHREVLEAIPFVEGWGVEIAMLVDLAARFGAASIGQSNLGARDHRHAPFTSWPCRPPR